MAKFNVIAEREAPRPLKQSGRLAARMREYEGYVQAVGNNQVGKVEPDDGESARGVALRIGRAARRLDRVADTWVVNETVYFKTRAAN